MGNDYLMGALDDVEGGEMKEPKPRAAWFYGMRTDPQRFGLGTWLEPEEICYPNGTMVRRARAVNVETGRLKVVRCGLSDTFFSIPVRGGGWLRTSEGKNRILLFYPPIRRG